jgi:hypothetical protein
MADILRSHNLWSTIMAKNEKTVANTDAAAPITDNAGLAWLAEKTVEWNGTSHSVASLPVQALAYLIDYGAGKSEQDCIAGLKGAIDGTGKQALSVEDRAKLETEHGTSDNAELFAAESAKRKAERWTRIVEGTIGTRSGGPRRVGIDKVMAEIATERLHAIAAERKAKLPTKAADLRPMIDKVLSRDPDGIRAEAERRMAQTASVPDDMFADLFSDE